MTHIEIVLLSIAALVGLALLVFWGSMAVHCYKNRELTTETRVLWLLAIVFGKLLGAGAYYFTRYRHRTSNPAPC